MKSEEQIQTGLWKGLSLLLAAALVMNGIAALLGWTEFAWWHLITLGICVLFWQPPVGKLVTTMKELGGKIVTHPVSGSYFVKGPARSEAPVYEDINTSSIS